MRFSDFTDGGVPAAGDFIAGHALAGGAGSDRRWTVANLFTNTPNMSITPSSLAAPALTITTSGAVNTSVIQGLSILNTPSGGITSEGYTFNQIFIDDNGVRSSTTIGLKVGYQVRGPWFGQKLGIASDIFVAEDPGSDPGGTGISVAMFASARGIANVTLYPNPIALFATNWGVTVSGTGYGTMVGGETDMTITSTGSALARVGHQILGGGAKSGISNIDYAYVFGADSDAAAWDYGLTWYGHSVKNATGTLIGSVNATTVKYGLDLSNVIFASGGFAYRSPSASIDGSGNLLSASHIITSNAFNALAVGPNGSASPMLRVDASSASAVTGLYIQGNAAAGGLTLTTTSTGTNEPLNIDAKGSGYIQLNGNATGAVIIGHALNYGGVTLTAAVTGTGKMVLDTSPTLIAPVLGVASATSLALSGTGGSGFVSLLTQASNPSAPASGFAFFADASGRLSWKRQSDGFVRTFDATLTANRVFTLPDASDTFAMLAVAQTLTNKTFNTASNSFTLNGSAFGNQAQANAALSSGMLVFKVLVDFNTANTDYPIAITLPTGFTRYIVNSVRLTGASASLTTATCGLFPAAGGAGAALVAGGTAITVSTASEETVNNAQAFTVPPANTSHTATTLYFRVGTAQGSPATGTVSIYIYPAS